MSAKKPADKVPKPDEVLRIMLNTPPQPRATASTKQRAPTKPKKNKPAE